MNYSQVLDLITQNSYDMAIDICNNEITNYPEDKVNYWYLGLALLLKGNASEAQTTWLMAMLDSEGEQLDQQQKTLLGILETEANKRRELNDPRTEFKIRYQIQELFPQYLDNLLQLVITSVFSEQYSEAFIEKINILDMLSDCCSDDIAPELLTVAVEVVLSKYYFLSSAIKLVEISTEKISLVGNKDKLLNILIVASHRIGVQKVKYAMALPIAEAALKLDPDNYGTLILLIQFHGYLGNSQQNIDIAKHFYNIAITLPAKIFGKKQILLGLIYSSRAWEETLLALEELEKSILELSVKELGIPSRDEALLAATSSFPFNYFRDQPELNRHLHNHLSTFCYHQIQYYAKDYISKFSEGISQRRHQFKTDKLLKVGYLSQDRKSVV